MVNGRPARPRGADAGDAVSGRRFAPPSYSYATRPRDRANRQGTLHRHRRRRGGGASAWSAGCSYLSRGRRRCRGGCPAPAPPGAGAAAPRRRRHRWPRPRRSLRRPLRQPASGGVRAPVARGHRRPSLPGESTLADREGAADDKRRHRVAQLGGERGARPPSRTRAPAVAAGARPTTSSTRSSANGRRSPPDDREQGRSGPPTFRRRRARRTPRCRTGCRQRATSCRWCWPTKPSIVRCVNEQKARDPQPPRHAGDALDHPDLGQDQRQSTR